MMKNEVKEEDFKKTELKFVKALFNVAASADVTRTEEEELMDGTLVTALRGLRRFFKNA